MIESIDGREARWHGRWSGYTKNNCRCEPCKEWKRANGRAYRENNKETIAGFGRAWRAANRSHVNELARRRRAENPDAANAAVARWRENHPERWKAALAKRGLKNRDAYLAKAKLNASNRRAIKAAATIVPFVQAQLNARMAYWGNRCWMCGGPFESVDHVKPLDAGGLHALANLRPACQQHNNSKKARWYGVAWVKSLTGAVPQGQSLPPGRPPNL